MERNKVLKERLVLKKSIKRFINQCLLSIIILLIGLILIKKNPTLKNIINKKVYEENIQFMKIKQIYDNYFGSLLPLNKVFKKEEAVFSENLSYTAYEKYKDGVKLKVNNNYMVPAIKEGIVVFIGEKEGYGNTIIVEQTDGVDVFYSNMKEVNVKLYDYIEKGNLLGEVNNNELYLVFQKEGNIIDYKNYI